MWRVDQIGNRLDAPEFGDNLWAKPFHNSGIAILAMDRKRYNSGTSDSAELQAAYYVHMEIQQIKALITQRGETQADLARLIGITPDQFSRSMLGKRKFTVREMDLLRRYFAEPGSETPLPVLFPIVGLVSAGAWREGFEQVMGYMPSPDKALSAKSFVVLIEGDSMDKVAEPGDGVIVDPTDLDLVSGKYYVIRNGEGETTFKQYREGPARLEPCSTNPIHQTIYPGRDGFTVIGRVRKRVADL
jgi:repressor LexA